jgi:hypothetical protein
MSAPGAARLARQPYNVPQESHSHPRRVQLRVSPWGSQKGARRGRRPLQRLASTGSSLCY